MDCILSYEKCKDDNLYKLIGCDESSTMEQIIAEYKTQSLLCHPDKNLDDPEAAIKFQKIQRAKDILTDPEKRALYDKWYRSGFTMPFAQFCNMEKACHTSIHWVTKKQKDLMLEHSCFQQSKKTCENETKSCPKNPTWQREPAGELLRKFRDYEI